MAGNRASSENILEEEDNPGAGLIPNNMADFPTSTYVAAGFSDKDEPSAPENIVRPRDTADRGKNSRKICCSAMISIVLLSCIVAVVYYLTKIDERYENTEPSLEFPVATTHNGHPGYTAPVKTSTPLKHKPRVLQHKRLQGKEEDSPVTLLDSDDDSFPSHTLKGGRHEQHATRTTKSATRRTHRTSRRSSKPPTTTTTTTTALRNSTMNSTLETHEEGGNQTTEESSSDGASTRKKTSKSAEQPRILVCVANGIAKADRYPPPGLCNYVIYAPVGYKRGLLRHNGTGFNVFKEQARNSRTSRWGIGMVPSDVLAAGTGVMGDDAPKFREEVQRLIREFRVVGYGLLDVHITAIDYIDTMNDYLEFYKYFKATLQKMQVPQDASTFLLFGVRVLNMIYSHRDTFRDKIRQVVKYIDIFIYQTHVSKVTRNCLSVFPSNRYYPGADDQDSLDDAVRTLSPPIYDRDGFHVVISLTLSLLRFNMKGADLEQIRKPCSNMTSMPFTVYCNSSGFSEDIEDEFQIGLYRYNTHESLVDTFETSEVIEFKMEDVLRELQYGGVHVGFAAFNLEHEDAKGLCGKSFARLKTVSKFLKTFT